MKQSKLFRKGSSYSSVLAMSVAGAMLSAPVFAQDSASTVTVDEAAPRVQLEQPAPKVTAQQSQTKVKVESGDPEVSVNQPKPEVEINQPEPEVSIQQAKPNVKVNEAEPQVDVNQAKPQVTINTAEPEIEIVEKDAQGENKQQEQQQANISAQSLEQVQLTKLEGKTIVNSNGKEIGSVEDIVADPQGGQAGFVVSVGGFFGIGDTKVLIPADRAQLNGEKIEFQTSQSADQLKQSNSYNESQYQSVTDRYDTLEQAQEAQLSSRSN